MGRSHFNGKILLPVNYIHKLTFSHFIWLLMTACSLESPDITTRWVSSLLLLCQASTADVFTSWFALGVVFLSLTLQPMKWMQN